MEKVDTIIPTIEKFNIPFSVITYTVGVDKFMELPCYKVRLIVRRKPCMCCIFCVP